MSKFDKKTIATVLAFASLFGNKTSATTINSQTVGAVGGQLQVIPKSSKKLKVWASVQKLQLEPLC